MLGADRLLLECVIDADGEGAIVANHVEATDWLGDAQRITGVRARDRLNDETFEIRAELTINAAGPFAGNLAENLPSPPPAAFGGLSQGLNLVVRRALTQDHAIAVSSRRRSDSLVPRADGRLFFIQPWQGLSLIGTSHLPYPGEPEHFAFDEAWLEDFLAEVNDAYPPAALTRDDVLYVYAGLTPAAKEPRGSEVQRTRRGVVLDHGEAHGIDGLVSLQGVKYTTARLVAESVVDLALAKLGRPPVACRSWQTKLPGARGFDPEAARQVARSGVTPAAYDAADALVADMGSLWPAVRERAGALPVGKEQLFAARVRHAIQAEMACSLEDVLLRRLDRVARGQLDGAELALAADVLAAERGWSADARATAIARFTHEIARHGRPGAASGQAASPPPDARETADHAN
jgi:glycerol-3-phosphate dehydrogenase